MTRENKSTRKFLSLRYFILPKQILIFNLRLNANELWLMKYMPLDSKTSDKSFGIIPEKYIKTFWKSDFTFRRSLLIFSGTISRTFFLSKIYPDLCHSFLNMILSSALALCSMHLIIWCGTINLVTLLPKITNLKVCSTSFLSSFLISSFWFLSSLFFFCCNTVA